MTMFVGRWQYSQLPKYVNKFVCGNLYPRLAELPWVFGACGLLL